MVASIAALSFGPLQNYTLFGKNFFSILLFICLNFLIPLGGFCAVLLVGWRWGIKKAFLHLREGAEGVFTNYPFLQYYFRFSIKVIAPSLIVIVMLDAFGFFF